MSINQDERFLKVYTPLGEGAMLLTAFRGQEAMSRLFEFELELLALDPKVDPKDLVGQSIVCEVVRRERDPRTFNGFVSHILLGGLNAAGMRVCRATLVPWLWFLTKRSNCRVFQAKTVVEIVESVLTEAGFKEFDTSQISTTPPAYEYCVQYQETDFDFISRLLEEEGIFYYFVFEAERHKLYFANATAAYRPGDIATLEFTDADAGTDQISRWEHGFEFISGSWTFADFNFTTPTSSMIADSPSFVSLPGRGSYERFEYPGRFSEREHGKAKVRARMEEEEVRYDVVHGAGTCDRFSLATTFALERHPIPSEENVSYVLVALSHSASEGSYGSSGSAATSYQNDFKCIPSSVLFRPERKTRRAVMHGPQTAIVVGPSGEEIHTDEHGRVKVRFHWDRTGMTDASCSCWIRVAQPSAGRKWGFQVVPRIGQEVVVEFIDGDPDRPLVTGAVYNASSPPAFALPASKTQSGFRSITSPWAGATAFNELRFEDKKGEEHIYIRAQKDEHHAVVESRFDSVGKDRHESIGAKSHTAIEGESHELIKGEVFQEFKAKLSSTVTGDRSVEVGGDHNATVKGNHVQKVSGELGLEVGKDQMIKVAMNSHRQAGQNVNDKAGMNMGVEAGMNLHIKGGMNVVVEAGMQLTLKAGPAFITLGPAGVDISGPMVKINSGGAAGAGSGCSPKAPGAPVAPALPKEPTAPMGAGSAEKMEEFSSTEHEGSKAELEWTAIQQQQAASLESAAASGQPFCDI